jgi:hypothetical protein
MTLNLIQGPEAVLLMLRGCIYIKYKNKRKSSCWAPVAQAYNPSYSGGRDQEDRGSKPAWANSLQDPISKNPSQK